MVRNFKFFIKNDYIPIWIFLGLIGGLFLYFLNPYKEGFQDSDCSVDEIETRYTSSEKTLVMFYADWCGHCKKLQPQWIEATEKSNGKMIRRNIGERTKDKKREAENKILAEKYDVDGYPTILVFQNGNAVPYEGPRTVEAFLENLQ
jgi:thiol-disulfide isomerase/thioredoxin